MDVVMKKKVDYLHNPTILATAGQYTSSRLCHWFFAHNFAEFHLLPCSSHGRPTRLHAQSIHRAQYNSVYIPRQSIGLKPLRVFLLLQPLFWYHYFEYKKAAAIFSLYLLRQCRYVCSCLRSFIIKHNHYVQYTLLIRCVFYLMQF